MIGWLARWIIGDLTPLLVAIGKIYDWLAVRFMKPVVFDGTLYASIAIFVFMQGFLSSDEAYKYCNPYLLFWSKFLVGSIAAGVGALKMFRSNSYSEHQKEQAVQQQQNPK